MHTSSYAPDIDTLYADVPPPQARASKNFDLNRYLQQSRSKFGVFKGALDEVPTQEFSSSSHSFSSSSPSFLPASHPSSSPSQREKTHCDDTIVPLRKSEHTTPQRLNETEAPYTYKPQMVRSVVEEAGLNGFVYIKGASGQRYVFSSIKYEQAFLYDDALFAVSTPTGCHITQHVMELKNTQTIYVHLLDDKSTKQNATLLDLGLIASDF